MSFDDLPRDHYGAILADPPWQFRVWSEETGSGRSASQHYKTMSPQEIYDLPVGKLGRRHCVLFLWVTWPMLEQGLKTIRKWGFVYKTCAFSWMKADAAQNVWAGTGYWTRANSEVCLLATKGRPRRIDAGVKQGIIAPRRQHSRKPDVVHQRIERLVNGPYLELFAREPRPGWTTWGDEADKFAGKDSDDDLAGDGESGVA